MNTIRRKNEQRRRSLNPKKNPAMRRQRATEVLAKDFKHLPPGLLPKLMKLNPDRILIHDNDCRHEKVVTPVFRGSPLGNRRPDIERRVSHFFRRTVSQSRPATALLA